MNPFPSRENSPLVGSFVGSMRRAPRAPALAGLGPNPATRMSSRAYELTPAIELAPLPAVCTQFRKRRWMVMDELLAYEDGYLRALQFLTYDIQDELLKNNAIMSGDRVEAIFAHLVEIRNLHQHFRYWLRPAVFGWAKAEILGWYLAAVVEQPGLLRLYTQYVGNYQHVSTLLTAELAGNLKMRRFLDTKGVDLEAYLLQPVHYLSQLLDHARNLVQFTRPANCDRAMLDHCVERAEKYVAQLAELRNHTETIVQLVARRPLLPAVLTPAAAAAASNHAGLLLHCEDLDELALDGRGRTVQTHRRRLFLTVDQVLCVRLGSASERPSQEQSSTRRLVAFFTARSAPSLKWKAALRDVVVRVGAPGGGGQRDVAGPAVGSPDPCNELLYLFNDYATVTRIKGLAGSLNGRVGSLTTGEMESVLKCIDSTIQERNQEVIDGARQRSAWWLQVEPKADRLHDRALKLTTFSLSASSMRKWTTMARLAQLAQRAENACAWWNGTVQPFIRAEPLYVERHAVTMEQLRSEITCGCYFAPNLESPIYEKLQMRDTLRHRNTLWICSTDTSRTFLTLYTHDLLTNGITERKCVTLDWQLVQSIVHVPDGQVVPDDPTTVDTVWLATLSKLLIYSGAFPYHEKQLESVDIVGTTRQMVYLGDRVCVGLSTGKLLLYKRGPRGWDLDSPQIISTERYPLVTMAAFRGNLYVAAEASILVFGGDSTHLRKIWELRRQSDHFGSLPSVNVDKFAHTVSGLWVVRYRSSVISLYHPHTGQHLQDIDVADRVMGFVAANQNRRNKVIFLGSMIHITALAPAEDSLWIGTNVGLTLTLPLPGVPNIPVLSDALTVSYHGHLGSVNLLLPLLRSPPRATPDVHETYGHFNVVELYRGRRRCSQDLSDDYENIMVDVVMGDGRPDAPAADTDGCAFGSPVDPCGPTTLMVVSGGRGYSNWNSAVEIPELGPPRGAAPPSFANSQIIVWEKLA